MCSSLLMAVPGAVDIIGAAASDATVSVNNQSAYRKGEYFHKELQLSNSNGPVSAEAKVVDVKNGAGANGEDATSEQTGKVEVPQTPESYSYDADGNMLSDGWWIYTWDCENRLISMTALASVPAESKRKLEFAYDYMGRRINKKVYNWNSGASAYQLQSTVKFIYDGWNLIAELDGNNALIRSYVWGQDVSGSMQGAGGIGGLLIVGDISGSYQVGYDGNGNVVGLVKAGVGTFQATYEYDPFGSTLRASGENAGSNPFRFSTKYIDSESGLLYYGYRYYNSQTGRWISRDPIGEAGGINLSAFTGNNTVNFIDKLGLYVEKDKIITDMDTLKNRIWDALKEIARDEFKTDCDCAEIEKLAKFETMERLGHTLFRNKSLYFLSKNRGWVDLNHLFSAVGYIKFTKLKYMPYLVKRAKVGIHKEINQAMEGDQSAFGFEDMPSNFLGLEFTSYMGTKMCDIPKYLEKFINDKLGGIIKPTDEQLNQIDALNLIRNFTKHPILSPDDPKVMTDSKTKIRYRSETKDMGDPAAQSGIIQFERQMLDTMFGNGITSTNIGIRPW
jgi:RHS repeat-associated protein